MTRATWKILEWGAVPKNAPTLEFDCPGCGRAALIPIVGLPLAQMGGGVVFDNTEHHMPPAIQCRHCRRAFEAA